MISRRLIVCGLSAAASAVGCTFAGASGFGDVALGDGATAFALRVISNRAAARAIANTYLAHVSPSEAAELLGRLATSLRQEAAALTRDAARRLARQLVVSDFRSARITIVDGWRLSNTEIALCVFATLSK